MRSVGLKVGIYGGSGYTGAELVRLLAGHPEVGAMGVSSRGYRQGPLSPREDAVYDFITMVAGGYLEGRVALPASRDSEVVR
jgi:hypothetical protein